MKLFLQLQILDRNSNGWRPIISMITLKISIYQVRKTLTVVVRIPKLFQILHPCVSIFVVETHGYHPSTYHPHHVHSTDHGTDFKWLILGGGQVRMLEYH